MDAQALTTLGWISILPPIVTIVMALKTKRVIESLFVGIMLCAFILDAHNKGFVHSLIYGIPQTFDQIAGHPEGNGLEGVGLLKDASRPQLLIFIVLLGAFMNLLDVSGGAVDFAKRATKYIRSKTSAILVSCVIGFSIFTSAYFCILVNGTIMRPIFDRLKISREKLAFLADAMSAPTKAWLPISGWIAYMLGLIKSNVPGITGDNVMTTFISTMPYNFYCWMMPIFCILLAFKIIPDFGSMRAAEKRVESGVLHKPGSLPMIDEEKEAQKASLKKSGRVSDMFIPLLVSVASMLVFGMWNKLNDQFGLGLPKLEMSTDTILDICFFLGILVAFVLFVGRKLMTTKEFMEHTMKGAEGSIFTTMIIVLALTLGDLIKALPPEGLGTAQFIVASTKPFIIPALLPAMIFLISAVISFATGTSWGTWALMMPIGVPLAISAGVDPIVTTAAVLSGGAFGDHCGPISDTCVLASVAVNVDHLEHVRTQIPYAVAVGIVAFFAFLVTGLAGL